MALDSGIDKIAVIIRSKV